MGWEKNTPPTLENAYPTRLPVHILHPTRHAFQNLCRTLDQEPIKTFETASTPTPKGPPPQLCSVRWRCTRVPTGSWHNGTVCNAERSQVRCPDHQVRSPAESGSRRLQRPLTSQANYRATINYSLRTSRAEYRILYFQPTPSPSRRPLRDNRQPPRARRRRTKGHDRPALKGKGFLLFIYLFIYFLQKPLSGTGGGGTSRQKKMQPTSFRLLHFPGLSLRGVICTHCESPWKTASAK